MQLREVLREQAEPLIRFVTNRPKEFGGLYFGQETGSLTLTVLQVASTPLSSIEAAKRLVPDGLNTEFRRADYSNAELDDARGRITAEYPNLRIAEVSVDVVGNRLGVVLDPGANPTPVRDLAAVATDITFGSGPQPATCTNEDACTPYRGGITIISHPDNHLCTWGFYGTRGFAAKYIITAGHCSIRGHTFSHAGITVTDAAGVDRDVFDSVTVSNSDSLTAHVAGSSNAVAPFNTIFAGPGDKAHTITGVRANDSQVVGSSVCFEGVVTSTTLCGTIEAVGLNYNLQRFDGQDVFMVNQVRMSRVVMSGDSGGPVYLGATAYGLVSAMDGAHANHMLYSRIGNVGSDMGINVCVTSAC